MIGKNKCTFSAAFPLSSVSHPPSVPFSFPQILSGLSVTWFFPSPSCFPDFIFLSVSSYVSIHPSTSFSIYPHPLATIVLSLIIVPMSSSQKRKTTTISVEVKKSQHKYIIGPKGNTLQEILEATGVSVEMPPLDSSSETIILRGEPDKLGPALTQVYAKVRTQ